MTEPNEAIPQTEGKKTRQRSPSYPFLSLPTAIQRARVLYDKDKKAVIPRDAAIRNWGFSLKSSYAHQTVASLKTYGLVEFVGNGLKLTTSALLILIGAADSPERAAAIRAAALAPSLFAAMWKTYGAEPPSDRTFVTTLVLHHGFPSEAAASEFIGKYKETIGFAKLAEFGSISATEAPAEDEGASLEDEMLDREVPMDPPPLAGGSPAGKGAVGRVGAPPLEAEGSLLFQVPFRGATMTVRIAAGQKLTKAHLARVRSYLELAEDDLEGA